MQGASRRHFLGTAAAAGILGLAELVSPSAFAANTKLTIKPNPDCPPITGVLAKKDYFSFRHGKDSLHFAKDIKSFRFGEKEILIANACLHDSSRGALLAYADNDVRKPIATLEIPSSIKLPKMARFGVSFDFDPKSGFLVSGTCVGKTILIKPDNDKTSIFDSKLRKEQISILEPKDENPFVIDSSRRPLSSKFFRNAAGELKILVLGCIAEAKAPVGQNLVRPIKMSVFDAETGKHELSVITEAFNTADQQLFMSPPVVEITEIAGRKAALFGSRHNCWTGGVTAVDLESGKNIYTISERNLPLDWRTPRGEVSVMANQFFIRDKELWIVKTGDIWESDGNEKNITNGGILRVELETGKPIAYFEISTPEQTQNLAIDTMTIIPGTDCLVGLGQRGGMAIKDTNANCFIIFINPLTQKWAWAPLEGGTRRAAIAEEGYMCTSTNGDHLYIGSPQWSYAIQNSLNANYLSSDFLSGSYIEPRVAATEQKEQPAPDRPERVVQLGQQPIRTWTRASDNKSLEGRCSQLDVKNSKVELIRKDGFKFWVPLEQLSESDRTIIQTLLATVAAN